MNQALTDYISKCRDKGMSDEDIKNNLIKAGWNETDVEEGIKNALGKESPNLDKREWSTLSIVGFILSIFMAPIGFILSIIALFRIHKRKQKGLGFAITGLIVGLLLTIYLVFIIGTAIMIVSTALGDEDLIRSIEQQSQQLSCGNQVNIEVVDIGGDIRACIDETKFNIMVFNKGLKDISSWEGRFIGETGLESSNVDSGLVSGEYATLSFEYDKLKTGEIMSLTILPQITSSNGEVPCVIPDLSWYMSEMQEISDCNEVTWDDN